MNLRVCAASFVIGLGVLGACPCGAMAQSRGSALGAAVSRIQQLGMAFERSGSRLTDATIRQIQTLATRNPTAAVAAANRAESQLNLQATRAKSSAARARASSEKTLMRQPDPDSKIMTLNATGERLEAQVDANLQEMLARIDEALASNGLGG